MTVAILKKDELRTEVEAASGGKQTVLYTVKGQPSYFNVIPAFRCEDLGPEYGTGLHPAFVVGGVEKSEIFIGTYQAIIRDGEALSLPGEDPANCINFDQARAACLAAGSGFHLMTNWEWAALALWCIKNGFGQLRGNTDSGRSHASGEESGKISKYGRTLTGSGPDAWRHDGTPYGIADLVGNVWEWNVGLKMVDGRIIMPPDNNFTLPEAEWPATGVRLDIADEGPCFTNEVTEQASDSAWFSDLAAENYEAAAILKRALLCPVANQDVSGRFWYDNTEGFEALPFRGGGWVSGDYAGLAALGLDFHRSLGDINLGFRPAFIG